MLDCRGRNKLAQKESDRVWSDKVYECQCVFLCPSCAYLGWRGDISCSTFMLRAHRALSCLCPHCPGRLQGSSVRLLLTWVVLGGWMCLLPRGGCICLSPPMGCSSLALGLERDPQEHRLRSTWPYFPEKEKQKSFLLFPKLFSLQINTL